MDDQEKELANKALKLLGKGMVKQTIVDRAKGPDAHKGPRLRKLAFKIIRMKYEESVNARMEQTLRQYADLQVRVAKVNEGRWAEADSRLQA